MENNNLPINRRVIKSQKTNNEIENSKSEKMTDDFAAAFPEWDLTPPAVVVKRVRRGI